MQNIESNIRATVLGARRYNINGEKFASIYLMTPSGESEDEKGALPSKLSCEYGLLDHMDGKKLPAEMDLSVDLRPGAKGVTGMYVRAARLADTGAGKPAATQK